VGRRPARIDLPLRTARNTPSPGFLLPARPLFCCALASSRAADTPVKPPPTIHTSTPAVRLLNFGVACLWGNAAWYQGVVLCHLSYLDTKHALILLMRALAHCRPACAGTRSGTSLALALSQHPWWPRTGPGRPVGSVASNQPRIPRTTKPTKPRIPDQIRSRSNFAFSDRLTHCLRSRVGLPQA